MIDRHWHWQFIAYNGEPAAESFKWGVKIDVIGFLSEADARIAAQDIVQRDQYALSAVWECASCGFHKQYAESMQDFVKAATS